MFICLGPLVLISVFGSSEIAFNGGELQYFSAMAGSPLRVVKYNGDGCRFIGWFWFLFGVPAVLTDENGFLLGFLL